MLFKIGFFFILINHVAPLVVHLSRDSKELQDKNLVILPARQELVDKTLNIIDIQLLLNVQSVLQIKNLGLDVEVVETLNRDIEDLKGLLP